MMRRITRTYCLTISGDDEPLVWMTSLLLLLRVLMVSSEADVTEWLSALLLLLLLLLGIGDGGGEDSIVLIGVLLVLI